MASVDVSERSPAALVASAPAQAVAALEAKAAKFHDHPGFAKKLKK